MQQGYDPFAKLVGQEEEAFESQKRCLNDFMNIAIDPGTNLIGQRWLTREGSMLVVAPSGHGKSSFCIQCQIHWALGRVAFGLHPARPLRILLIESEDDDADNKSFVQVIRTLNLSPAELALLANNTRVEFRRDLSGERFLRALDSLLDEWAADLVMINPLTGFYTTDLRDEEAMADFLRNRINSLMVKHRCAPMIVAHMPKGQVAQLENKQWYEWMYILSGCVTLTNWARAILVFIPSAKTPGIYRFIAAKRPAQSGWTQAEYCFSHSKTTLGEFEIIQWIPASEDQIKEVTPPKPAKVTVTPNEVYAQMSPLRDYSRDAFRQWCRDHFKIGRDLSDQLRTVLIEDGSIEVIHPNGDKPGKSAFFRKCNRNR